MTPTQEYIQKAIKEFRENFVGKNSGFSDWLTNESGKIIESFLEQKLKEIAKITELAIRDEAESLEQLKPVIKYHNKLSSQETAKEEKECTCEKICKRSP